MTPTTCELMRIQSFLSEMGVIYNKPMMYVANNHVFNERTMHIEVDYHFIIGTVISHRIVTSFVTSSCQYGDIFIKSLSRKFFNFV